MLKANPNVSLETSRTVMWPLKVATPEAISEDGRKAEKWHYRIRASIKKELVPLTQGDWHGSRLL
ncbi:hypothetical protein GCM10010520_52990 [Rhizobium viscosum]